MRRPPRLAIWVLEWLGYSAQNPALVGDLVEEFARGRSAGWFWRQAAWAVAVGMRRNARDSRWYLAAALSGYSAASVAAVGMAAVGIPPQVHGVVAAALACVLLFVLYVAARVWMRRASRLRDPNYKLLLYGGGAAVERQRLMMFAGIEEFATWVYAYATAALFAHLAPGEWAEVGLFWMGIGAVEAVAWVPGPVRERPAKAAVEERVWIYPAPQVRVRVAMADGREIELRPETVAESVLAAGDEELARVLFGGAASLEEARRVVWRASERRYLDDCAAGRPVAAMGIGELAYCQEMDSPPLSWRSRMERLVRAKSMGTRRPS